VAEGLSPMIAERCFPAPRIVEDLSACVKNAGRRAALDPVVRRYLHDTGKSLFVCDCVVGWEDSNLQPNDYQPPALSIEHSGAVS
jgi:hypothetical protein